MSFSNLLDACVNLRFRAGVLTTQVDDTLILLDQNHGRFLSVQGAGVDVCLQLAGCIRGSDLYAHLALIYPLDGDTLRSDLASFLEVLRELDLLEVENLPFSPVSSPSKEG